VVILMGATPAMVVILAMAAIRVTVVILAMAATLVMAAILPTWFHQLLLQLHRQLNKINLE